MRRLDPTWWFLVVAACACFVQACYPKHCGPRQACYKPPPPEPRQPYWDGGATSASPTTADAELASSTTLTSSMPAGCSPPYIQVACGSDHTCALDHAGCVACWGRNSNHFGEYAGQARPPEGRFQYISAGSEHSCGIRVDGSLQCWGEVKIDPAPTGPVAEVSADHVTTCARMQDGQGTCWSSYLPPLPIGLRLKQLVSGEDHACGIDALDNVECWGGEMGSLQGTFTELAAGGRTTCGIRSDGTIACSSFFADPKPPEGEFAQLDVAFDFACAVRLDGAVRCWGILPEPDFAVPGGRFVSVSVGQEPGAAVSGHACAIDEDGRLHCWGANLFGQATVPASL